MTERRDDVPLSEATLMWSDNREDQYDGASDQPATLPPPIVGNHGAQSVPDPENYDNATGACFRYWKGNSDEERLAELMRDAWMAVVRDRVDPQAMHDALLAVPEFRATIHYDELPECYRADDTRRP